VGYIVTSFDHSTLTWIDCTGGNAPDDAGLRSPSSRSSVPFVSVVAVALIVGFRRDVPRSASESRLLAGGTALSSELRADVVELQTITVEPISPHQKEGERTEVRTGGHDRAENSDEVMNDRDNIESWT
jgi:hypothetical protein